MQLLNTVNTFINDLTNRLPREAAVAATKQALQRQIQKKGKVLFEIDGENVEFSKEEVRAIWKDIK